MKSSSSKSSRQVKLSRTSDVPMILFLWRWKVSTTAVLARRFYSERSGYRAYARLWKLEKAGFVKSRVDESGRNYIWTLDKRGFALAKDRIHHMKEEGYLSENPIHDLLVSAIHLGDGVFSEMDGIEYFTEQELRRIDPVFFPSWVPQSKRRPDGYWYLKEIQSGLIVALEVELSSKADVEYESIARFYDEREDIHRVIWVVQKPSMANKIHALMQEFSLQPFKHSVMLLEPFYSLGWQAPIHCGVDTGKSLNHVLGNQYVTDTKQVSAQFSLDTRKAPFKSVACELFRL